MPAASVPFHDLPDGGAPAEAAQQLAAAFRSVEERLACRVTIHDHFRELSAGDGSGLVDGQRHVHLHPACRAAQRLGGADGCLAHCMRACGARASSSPVPFTAHCWAGLQEIVVPLWWDGRHRATIFVGPWPAGRIPAEALALARTVADVCAAAVARTALVAAAGDRRSVIGRAAAAGESLGTLAARLGLSPTQAGRVARACCGRPWRRVLLEQRLRSARQLLLTTDLSCAAIAGRLGYATPGHFHRCFRRAEGLAPGAWRARARA